MGEPPEFPVEPWIHEGDIWLAADSRISMPTEHGRIPTTDAAMKILPITLRFFQEHEDGGPGMTPTYHPKSPSPGLVTLNQRARRISWRPRI
jgi:hypothetical protein